MALLILWGGGKCKSKMREFLHISKQYPNFDLNGCLHFLQCMPVNESEFFSKCNPYVSLSFILFLNIILFLHVIYILSFFKDFLMPCIFFV